MRAAIATAVVAVAFGAAAAPASAEPLPPGAVGVVFGAVAGTGADNKVVGAGVYFFDTVGFLMPLPGIQASWQPTTTERRWGWTIRGSVMFARMYGGSAAQIESPLHTVQLDLTVGLRYRPWRTPTRYLTIRGGGELLRANEPIPPPPPKSQRAFAGGIASVGLDQYAGPLLLSFDVRYGLIGSTGPSEVALIVGFALVGP
jgi:hypothetical protein